MVSPVTVQLTVGAVAEQVPDGDPVTVYDVAPVTPVQLTLAEALPAVAVTLVGGLISVPSGVTGVVGDVYGELPIALFASIRKT